MCSTKILYSFNNDPRKLFLFLVSFVHCIVWSWNSLFQLFMFSYSFRFHFLGIFLLSRSRNSSSCSSSLHLSCQHQTTVCFSLALIWRNFSSILNGSNHEITFNPKPKVQIYAKMRTKFLLWFFTVSTGSYVIALNCRSIFWLDPYIFWLDPAYMFDMIASYVPPRSVRSSNKNLLIVPDIRSEMGRRSFSFAAPTFWNSLPQHIRSSDSLSVFKGLLKTFSDQKSLPP